MTQTQDNTESMEKPRIFVSYKRNSAPDEPIAKELAGFLENQNFNVFIDQTLPVGDRWAAEIEAELSRADFLVVLLSANSINSQMVKGEITTAQRLYETQGKPKILPVRVNYRDPFQYPLSAILDPLNWAFWERDEDTGSLFDEITVAIKGGKLSIKDKTFKERLIQTDGKDKNEQIDLAQPLADAQPLMGTQIPFGTSPGDVVDPQSLFYIKRQSDKTALAIIQEPLATVNIQGPEQIGKSSLLFSTLAAANEAGKRVAFIDFQLFDKSTFQDANKFYKVFCSHISREIGVKNETASYWQQFDGEGNVICATQYMRDYLLKAIGSDILVLAIDEIESVFDSDFRDEFLLMLRTWHQKRAQPPPQVRDTWRRLNLVLVVSTEPHDLIKSEFVSPFNIGTIIEINDFSQEEIWELNKRHGYPLTEPEAGELMELVCGHPYLVRRALYSIATKACTFKELKERATNESGPFGDHLRYHLFRLRNKTDLIDELRQMFNNKKALNREAFRKLRGAGLVKNEFEQAQFRCQLYESFFKRHFSA